MSNAGTVALFCLMLSVCIDILATHVIHIYNCLVSYRSETCHWLYISSPQNIFIVEVFQPEIADRIRDESQVLLCSCYCSLSWCQRCYFQVYFFCLISVGLYCNALPMMSNIKLMLHNSVRVKVEEKHI